MSDLGLTHVGLPVTDIDRSLAFYAKYAGMAVVHRRADHGPVSAVAWLSDRTRPFVIVLLTVARVDHPLLPFGHLGVGCASREEVDRLCALADADGILIEGPHDTGPPVGYWALIRDPDRHTLEVSFGQEVALSVEESS